MRIEYAKSKARAERWAEEKILVQEEMRRTIAYMEWRATWWAEQARKRHLEGLTYRTSCGIKAYAKKHETFYKVLAKGFARKWRKYLREQGLEHSWADKYEDAPLDDIPEVVDNGTTGPVRPLRIRAGPGAGLDDDSDSEDNFSD